MKKITPENIVLDDEEQWIEDHLEEFVPAEKWVGESLREAAKNPSVVHYADRETKKPVTLRLDANDVNRLKVIALEQGLQYQSLIGSVLHRFCNGNLVDVSEARKIAFAR